MDQKVISKMDKTKAKTRAREKRHMRVRAKIVGTKERPRLNVYRSNAGIYAQIIDDSVGETLVSASTVDKKVRDKLRGSCNKKTAALVGELVAQRAIEANIKTVVFDRGGYVYHGRLKALADAVRSGGVNI